MKLKFSRHYFSLFFILLSFSSFSQEDTISKGKYFNQLAMTVGGTMSGQTHTPPVFGEGGSIFTASFTVTPTIFSFGAKKQYGIDAALSFIQKGGNNVSPIYSYSTNGQIGGIGSETDAVTINYLSLTPTIRINFWKIMFARVGPRMDVFTSFSSHQRFCADTWTNNDFNPVTLGVTYGVGISPGKKRVRFMLEFQGQNDFTNSCTNTVEAQTCKNWSYILNAGIVFVFDNKKHGRP